MNRGAYKKVCENLITSAGFFLWEKVPPLPRELEADICFSKNPEFCGARFFWSLPDAIYLQRKDMKQLKKWLSTIPIRVQE